MLPCLSLPGLSTTIPRRLLRAHVLLADGGVTMRALLCVVQPHPHLQYFRVKGSVVSASRFVVPRVLIFAVIAVLPYWSNTPRNMSGMFVCEKNKQISLSTLSDDQNVGGLSVSTHAVRSVRVILLFCAMSKLGRFGQLRFGCFLSHSF